MNKTRITEILKGLSIYDGIYKRAEVDGALELQEEITPFLIEILEKVLADPVTYAENIDYHAHVYALILLGHFREQASHRLIIDVFSLPPDLPERLFGDAVSETLPIVLLRTYPGSTDLIKSLILNKQADDACRGSASRALIYLATEGVIEREEVLSFFATLFTGNEAAPESSFWSYLAGSMQDFYPEELMGAIEKAYEDELIGLWFIGLEDLQRTLKRDRAQVLKQLKAEIEQQSIDNVHDYMSWWAAFKQEKPALSATVPPVAAPVAAPVAPPAAPPVAAPVSPPKKKPIAKAGVPKAHKKAQRKKKRKKGGASKKKKRR